MNNSSVSLKCNTTEWRSNDKDYWLEVWIVIFVCFIIGIVANLLILVVVKRTPSMHCVTNVLLCNLAVLDLMTLLWPLFHLHVDVFDLPGNVRCKFTWSIPAMVCGCSVLTLSLIAVERYQALVNAMVSSTLRLTLQSVKYALFAIWILAMFTAIPVVVLLEYDECLKDKKVPCRLVEGFKTLKALAATYDVLITFVPTIITCFCYSRIVSGVCISKTILGGTSAGNEEVRMRKKLVHASVFAATAFVLCYAPVGITSVLYCLDALHPNFFSERAITALYAPMCVKAIINPFLYAFLSTNYRTAVKSMCRCCQNENTETKPQGSHEFGMS